MTDPSFYVSVAGKSFPTHPTKSGVPQGAILALLLFNVLLKDIPSIPNVTTAIYADDMTMFAFSDTLADAGDRLQRAID